MLQAQIQPRPIFSKVPFLHCEHESKLVRKSVKMKYICETIACRKLKANPRMYIFHNANVMFV